MTGDGYIYLGRVPFSKSSSLTLLFLIFTGFILPLVVAENGNNWEMEAPINMTGTLTLPGSNTTKKVALEYPWQPAHENRRSRKNFFNRAHHADWKQADRAYCFHVKPGYFELPYNPAKHIGMKCHLWMHNLTPYNDQDEHILQNLEKMNAHSLAIDQSMGCVPDEPIPGLWSEDEAPYWFRLWTSVGWDKVDHCRAGCESCFDAMQEYGAEEAHCVRWKGPQRCEMSVTRRDNGRHWNQKDYPNRIVYYGDEMERGYRIPVDE